MMKISKPVLFFVIVLVLLFQFPLRLDFSKNKAYSLSHSTKKIVSKIHTPLTITLYISSDIPSRIEPLRRDVVDFLNEYVQVSANKIRLVQKDPAKDNKAKKEAILAGLPQLQFSEIEADQYKVSSSFFGLSIDNGREMVVIPQVINTTTLENDITASIFRMERTTPQKIALINFSSLLDPRQDTFSSLKRSLEKQFVTVETPLATSSPTLDVQNHKAAIIVVDGQNPITTGQQTILSQYLTNGGSLIMFVDGVIVADDLEVTPVNHHIAGFLEKYGVLINNDLVLSESAQNANFASGLGAFVVKYPFWVMTNNFEKESVDFSNVNQLVFPWASSLKINNSKGAKILLRSSPNSWRQENNFSLIPNTIVKPQKKDFTSHVLMSETQVGEKGNFLVISTSRFARDQYLSQDVGNIEFMINVLNRYVAGGALSGVRSRASITSPLKSVTQEQKNILRFFIVGAFPAILAIYGALRLYRRNS